MQSIFPEINPSFFLQNRSCHKTTEHFSRVGKKGNKKLMTFSPPKYAMCSNNKFYAF